MTNRMTTTMNDYIYAVIRRSMVGLNRVRVGLTLIRLWTSGSISIGLPLICRLEQGEVATIEPLVAPADVGELTEADAADDEKEEPGVEVADALSFRFAAAGSELTMDAVDDDEVLGELEKIDAEIEPE